MIRFIKFIFKKIIASILISAGLIASFSVLKIFIIGIIKPESTLSLILKINFLDLSLTYLYSCLALYIIFLICDLIFAYFLKLPDQMNKIEITLAFLLLPTAFIIACLSELSFEQFTVVVTSLTFIGLFIPIFQFLIKKMT